MISALPSSLKVKPRERLQLRIHGTVQGIGFRPFVYRLAHQLSLAGWVANTGQGALLELEGDPGHLWKFQERIISELPEAGFVQRVTSTKIPVQGEQSFAIHPNQSQGQRQSVLSPDLATCQDCLADMTDPRSRRYGYPFTTCAHCGPRYSLVRHLPYDRKATTMAAFPLCQDCQREFQDPLDRRFHAETIACPTCGPQVELWDEKGKTVGSEGEAWQSACNLIRNGHIVAVKGLGGFHLLVNALDDEAVQRLRMRKHRPDKPFAVLFPTLQNLQAHCLISPEEECALTSSAAPIVLVKKRIASSLAQAVAPANPYVGAMLPYTPLHHLITASLGFPVVATSGNRSEEPLVYEQSEIVHRLEGIADAFLVHNRPIARPIDDSVVRIVNGKPLMLRRSRGYVPTSLLVPTPQGNSVSPTVILAVGGHLKNTIALFKENQIFASQHVGDLSTAEASRAFERTVDDFLNFYDCAPQAIACDAHPDYRSTQFSRTYSAQHRLPVIPVQHHHAHIAACMAQHQLTGPVLGVAWDGSGYGSDNTLWGGEFLLCHEDQYTRVGTLRPFPLPGGTICIREPRRVAFSLLHAVFGEGLKDLELPPLQSLGPDMSRMLTNMIQRHVHSPPTSSMGRLFDGVSAVLGLHQATSFEGQAAMSLEFLADSAAPSNRSLSYHLPIHPSNSPAVEMQVADWHPMIERIVRDCHEGWPSTAIAWGFHQALANLIGDMARRVACPQIVLSGGVFQNAVLLTLTQQELASSGIPVFIPTQFGPNDGGLSLGQCLVARNHLLEERQTEYRQQT